ncbi:hypothetical protein CN918_28255 [Priestia megaterium]|nr:hypothetical protein CN918_28255 [Priestia megaterium]
MRNKFEKRFLRTVLLLSVASWPVLYKKQYIKDFFLAFILNGFSNGIIDKFLVNRKWIDYPVRFFRKEFKIHVIFDFLLYPTVSLMINIITRNDKFLAIICKIFLIITPMFLIELWAEKKTNLINWHKPWRWYHSFITLFVKSLSNRLTMGLIKKIAEKQQNPK